MTKQEIIHAITDLIPLERIEIREALDELLEQDKEAYLAQGEKMYGRKRRKRASGDEQHAESEPNHDA
jgi:hypothetical protein